MISEPSTVSFIVDQQLRQVQNVQALQPINGPQIVGVDGSKTPPQVNTMVSPLDGELPKPSTVGDAFYRKAREIRRDPTIRMVRELAMAPILMAEWEFEAADDAPEGAKELIESIMGGLRLPLLRSSLCGMCDFGWQPFEIIAEQRQDGVSAPRLKPLLQDITNILVNAADGSFFGLRQTPTVGQRIGWIYLLDQECFVVSQDVEGTNWYGEPTLRSVEKTYDEAEVVNKSSRKYDAKVAGTHWVIYYPLGTSTYEGVDRDNGWIAKDLLARAEAVNGIAVPRSVVDSLDSMNAAMANSEASQWKIELLSDSGKGQQPFTDRQKYLDVLKVRAFGFPERAILEGQFGTKAEAETHADMAVSNVEVRHALLCLQYNQKVVDLILTWNYGPDARGKVWVKPSPLADDTKGFFRQVYLALIANPQGFMTEVSALDLHQMRERLGMPEVPMMEAGYADPWGAGMVDPVTGQLLMTPDPAAPADPMAVPQLTYAMAFDPNEPRDDQGRWTDGAAHDASKVNIDHWGKILEKDAKRGKDRLRSFLASLATARDFGEKIEDFHERRGLTHFVRWAREVLGIKPTTLSMIDDIDSAASRARKPTDAQREAGNYRKGHVTIHGLDVTIETPRGKKRKKKWPKLPAHYGYFKGTEGADGDHVDVFIGPQPQVEVAFVANMKNGSGEFDEHKVLLGFKSRKKAVACLREAYGGADHRIGKVHAFTIPGLKRWLAGNTDVALSQR